MVPRKDLDLSPAYDSSFVVLIPAYQPQKELLDVVSSLGNPLVKKIVVVNDGSNRPESLNILEQVRKVPGVEVIDHITNLGKGAALKTGLNYACVKYPEIAGVVTADADGQHLASDICNIGDQMCKNPTQLILGIRSFGKGVPLRSRIGNLTTVQVLRIITGIYLQDTQTGLRGIPTNLIPKILRSKANQYEYELDMLLMAKKHKFPILQLPIQTVYIDDNKNSHFNPLVDSMKIYFVFIRFTAVSILSAIIDYAVFIFTYFFSNNLLVSQYVARTVAGAFNYTVNKKETFHNRSSVLKSLPRYVLLLYVMGLISFSLIQVLVDTTTMSIPSAKLAAEGLLFVASFAVQKVFVFNDDK